MACSMLMKTFARITRSGPALSLGPRLFRKEMLRVGEWRHPSAPDGKLKVDQGVLSKLVENFRAGLRDDVPIPLGHDMDAIENSGHVVGLELEGDKLFGIIEVKDEDIAQDLEAKKITGGSALLNLNYVDAESGKEHGPTLIHWALTNAPYIKGLASYEAVALGEEAIGAVFIALDENDRIKEGGMDPIKEALEKLKEASDDDLRKALMELRPDLFKAEGDESDVEEQLEAAKAEGQKELVAALAEKGVVVTLSESGPKPEAKVESAPEFVALSEEVATLRKERLEEKANAVIDSAIGAGKLLPAQKDALLEIALSEDGKGLERIEKLIPEKPIVDLKEHGVTVTEETNVKLSEEDAEGEADRYIGAYSGQGKKGDS